MQQHVINPEIYGCYLLSKQGGVQFDSSCDKIKVQIETLSPDFLFFLYN